MLFELSEDEFCSLDLDDPKLNGPQGNLFASTVKEIGR